LSAALMEGYALSTRAVSTVEGFLVSLVSNTAGRLQRDRESMIVWLYVVIIVGLLTVAYLEGVCIWNGYHGFSGNLSVAWNNGFQLGVWFGCV
jgi:hypothetical protein